MPSLKEFFMPEGLKVDVTSPDGEQVHISKDDDPGLGHGLAPGLPVGAPPPAPPIGAEPPLDVPPLMDEPAGEEPAEEPIPELPESLKRLGEMVGFRLAEADDEIDLSDLEDKPTSSKSSSADEKGSEKKSFSKKGEIDPETLAAWRKEMSVRDATKPKGHDGRWYGKTALPGWDDPEHLPAEPKGISGEWSWQDLQDERPELAAAFQETGVDPESGDFLGDEGRTMFVPKGEDENAWQWSEGEGWTEMTPEVWQDIADVRDQQAGRSAEIDAMPQQFDPSFLDQGEEEPANEPGAEGPTSVAADDEPEMNLGDFVPNDDEPLATPKAPEDPTSSRAKEEPKKSAAKGSGRAPEVGTPEWEDFLKSLE